MYHIYVSIFCYMRKLQFEMVPFSQSRFEQCEA